MLAVFGNSYLGKLVLLAPVVALYVRLQEDFLFDQFGLTHALWLYWSLIAISVGQLAFALFCPVLIKKYGNDIERFMVEDQSARTVQARRILKRDQIRSYFVAHGGKLEPQDMGAHDIRQRMPNNEVHTAISQFLSAYAANNPDSLSFSQRTLNLQASNRIDTIVANANSDDKGVKRQVEELRSALWAAERERQGDDSRAWDIEALSWEHRTNDQKNSSVRALVSFLYGAGSLYFIYSGIRGVAIMFGYTLGMGS